MLQSGQVSPSDCQMIHECMCSTYTPACVPNFLHAGFVGNVLPPAVTLSGFQSASRFRTKFSEVVHTVLVRLALTHFSSSTRSAIAKLHDSSIHGLRTHRGFSTFPVLFRQLWSQVLTQTPVTHRCHRVIRNLRENAVQSASTSLLF